MSGSFFQGLGVRPALGRLIGPAEDPRGGGVPVAVLSHAYWQARFAGDASVIGRTVTINNYPFQVIGVVEPRFTGLDLGRPARMYVPVTMQPQLGPAWLHIDGRRFRWVQVYARLRPPITRERAKAALDPLYASLLAGEAEGRRVLRRLSRRRESDFSKDA